MWDSGYRAGLDGEEEVRNQLCKKRLAELLGRPPETKQCNEWGTRWHVSWLGRGAYPWVHLGTQRLCWLHTVIWHGRMEELGLFWVLLGGFVTKSWGWHDESTSGGRPGLAGTSHLLWDSVWSRVILSAALFGSYVQMPEIFIRVRPTQIILFYSAFYFSFINLLCTDSIAIPFIIVYMFADNFLIHWSNSHIKYRWFEPSHNFLLLLIVLLTYAESN